MSRDPIPDHLDPCPACQEPIGDYPWIRCSLCRTPHHERCWPRCTNCGASATASQPSQQTRGTNRKVMALIAVSGVLGLTCCFPIPISLPQGDGTVVVLNAAWPLRILCLLIAGLVIVRLQDG